MTDLDAAFVAAHSEKEQAAPTFKRGFADHITVVKQALTQLSGHVPGRRPGKKVLVRTDGAGGTHEFVQWLTKRRLSYSVGFTLPDNTPAGMRVIARKGRHHPEAQLRCQDVDGMRITAFATNTAPAARAPSWPSSSSAAAGHAARTGSAARRTPGWPTCPWHRST